VITAAKRQEVAVLRHAVLAVADVATLFEGIRESCFLCKKVAKWYKDLLLKAETQNRRKRPVPPKNVSPPLLSRFR
jgi:hypothetical protein